MYFLHSFQLALQVDEIIGAVNCPENNNLRLFLCIYFAWEGAID